MPNEYAAIWSAVAASGAALSAFLTWRVQRRNLLMSVKPELVLDGWGRRTRGAGPSEHEVIEFTKIKNAGRGVALHVVLNCHHDVDNRPTAIMSTTRLAILPPGEERPVEGGIIVWWKNVPDRDGAKYLPLEITVGCLDSAGMRHETTYSLLASQNGFTFSPDGLVPGLMLGTRSTATRALWMLRLTARRRRWSGWLATGCRRIQTGVRDWARRLVAQLRRVPLLGRLFRQRNTTT